jgi:Tfp pilus assembly protein PilE
MTEPIVIVVLVFAIFSLIVFQAFQEQEIRRLTKKIDDIYAAIITDILEVDSEE